MDRKTKILECMGTVRQVDIWTGRQIICNTREVRHVDRMIFRQEDRWTAIHGDS